MRVSAVLKTLGALLAIYLGWMAWPIYGFFAHNGDFPLPPTGWQELSQEAPSNSELYNPNYARASDEALEALSIYRDNIGVPSLSAAVAIRGDVVGTGQAGWADIDKNEPATEETRYRIGSTSKAVTATALARLVERGVIDLDAPLSAYFDPLPNEEWAEITTRQLASHMAGMPHYGDNTDYAGLLKMMTLRHKFESMHDAVALFDESDLLFEPGTQFEYSSLGTVLLGALMSKATGKAYLEIIEEEVLTPAGMENTMVAPKRAGHEDRLATFYYRNADQYREWRPVDLSHRLPGGGYASTPTDLVKMGSLYFDDTYLKAETKAAFWAPQKLNNGETNPQDYAIGWRWREYEVDGVKGYLRNANHGGVSRGSQSWLLVFPDYQMAIAFNTNTKTQEFHTFGMLWQEIARPFAVAHPDYAATTPASE